MLKSDFIPDYLVGPVDFVEPLLGPQEFSEVGSCFFCFQAVLQGDSSVFFDKVVLARHKPVERNLGDEKSVVRQWRILGLKFPVSRFGHRIYPIYLGLGVPFEGGFVVTYLCELLEVVHVRVQVTCNQNERLRLRLLNLDQALLYRLQKTFLFLEIIEVDVHDVHLRSLNDGLAENDLLVLQFVRELVR